MMKFVLIVSGQECSPSLILLLVLTKEYVSTARDAFTEMIVKHIQKCDHIERSLDLKLVLCIDNTPTLLEFHR